MAKSFSQIQTDTRTYLDEASQADFLDTEVKTAINYAYHNLISKVIEVYDGWYQDVTTTPFTYAIVANQQEYTIDSSIIKPTRVEINYNPTTSGSVPARAIPIKMDEIRGNLGNTSTGGSFFSAGYYIRGNIGAQKIGFIPIPQTADPVGTKSISVWGYVLPPDLSASGDDVNIPYADNYAYLISLRAAAQLLRKGQQEENAAERYMQEYQNGVMEMQTFLKDRQSDDGQYIIDSLNEPTDFSTNPVL